MSDPHITDIDREHARRIVAKVGTIDDHTTVRDMAEIVEDVAGELAHIRPTAYATTTPADVQDLASEAICTGRFVWCRARLLHALTGAARQSVLDEVLEELLTDDNATLERILRALAESGWSHERLL